jgi:hypothetical protein
MRSAILASGSGTNRTSLVRGVSMDSPITDISGSITTSQPIVMIRCRVPLIVELIIIAHSTPRTTADRRGRCGLRQARGQQGGSLHLMRLGVKDP